MYKIIIIVLIVTVISIVAFSALENVSEFDRLEWILCEFVIGRGHHLDHHHRGSHPARHLRGGFGRDLS
jgi:hypothetical protein